METPIIYERPADFRPTHYDGTEWNTPTSLINGSPAVMPAPGAAQSGKLAYFAAYPDAYSDKGWRAAKSSHRPVIFDESGVPVERSEGWNYALKIAAQYHLSPEWLFVGRDLRLAVSMLPNNRPRAGGWDRTPDVFYILRAVQIMGDLMRFEALEDQIETMKDWFR